MPTTDTKLQQLVINVGTKAQIESAIAGGTITQDMLSVTTDGDTYIQGVKVNGSELTPDANNKVDVTVPTVNNATLTIQKNGSNVATFTANSSTNATANITVPTNTNQLTNGAGFITSSALSGYATETWVGNQGYITGITSGDVTTALGYTPYDDSNPDGYTSNVGTVTSVNNTSPDSDGNVSISIPTVNNATLTIQKNGTDVATFTANSSTNQTANITVPTDTNDLTNGAGYITGITSSDVTTALGYTPYNSSNPSGYQANVLDGVQVNGTDLTITNKKVNVSVPTQASDINAQPTLVSGTNIKTVNGNSLLGRGDLVISGLPSQTSQSGKFLTTNGTSASWANIPTEIPSQSGQNGKFLTTNGSSVSWATVNALPSQTGNSGKYLTTNGTTASWGEIAEYTAQEVETLWGSL